MATSIEYNLEEKDMMILQTNNYPCDGRTTCFRAYNSETIQQ